MALQQPPSTIGMPVKSQVTSKFERTRCYFCGEHILDFPYVRYKLRYNGSDLITRYLHPECWDEYPEIGRQGIVGLAAVSPTLIVGVEG